MFWLLRKMGYRDRTYRGVDFSVRIKKVFRELVSIIYTRGGTSIKLSGQYIGQHWEGIEVHIPRQIEAEQVSRISSDLETAFQAMHRRYLIVGSAGTDVIPEDEREAAIAELREMGWEIEVSPDRKQIRQKRAAGAPPIDAETTRKMALRMKLLIEAIHGTRQRLQVLAKSKEL
jgi:hypothetical protein